MYTNFLKILVTTSTIVSLVTSTVTIKATKDVVEVPNTMSGDLSSVTYLSCEITGVTDINSYTYEWFRDIGGGQKKISEEYGDTAFMIRHGFMMLVLRKDGIRRGEYTCSITDKGTDKKYTAKITLHTFDFICLPNVCRLGETCTLQCSVDDVKTANGDGFIWFWKPYSSNYQQEYVTETGKMRDGHQNSTITIKNAGEKIYRPYFQNYEEFMCYIRNPEPVLTANWYQDSTSAKLKINSCSRSAVSFLVLSAAVMITQSVV